MAGVVLAVLGALALQACASKAPPYETEYRDAAGPSPSYGPSYRPSYRVAGPSANLARDEVAPLAAPRTVIEDDGIAEQAAPRVRSSTAIPDDPTEPFSPNYGTVPVRDKPQKSASLIQPAAFVPTSQRTGVARGPRW